MFFGLGPLELILLGVLFVAFFGLKKVPLAARELGRIHGTIQKLKLRFPFLLRFFK